MWRRHRTPRKGDRRTVPLPGTVEQLWAHEEHDGRLWQLQAISTTPPERDRRLRR